MSRLHLLLSDIDQDTHFLQQLKKRSVDQQFSYMDERASLYCDKDLRKQDGSVPTKDDLKTMLKETLPKGEKTAIVSVGCANSALESEVLQELYEEGYQFTYFGLDTSREMLRLSEEKLKQAQYEIHLLFGDFMAPTTTKEITALTSHFPKRIFLFLGSTIGNIHQSAAIDSLYNLLHKGETIILETGIRPSLSKEDDIKIFKRSKQRLEDEEWMYLYFAPLQKVGVPFEHGKMMLETSRENSADAIYINFSFRVEKRTEISYRGETLHFLPGERLYLFDIHLYYPPTFKNSVEERGFTFIDEIMKGRRGMYVFERN